MRSTFDYLTTAGARANLLSGHKTIDFVVGGDCLTLTTAAGVAAVLEKEAEITESLVAGGYIEQSLGAKSLFESVRRSMKGQLFIGYDRKLRLKCYDSPAILVAGEANSINRKMRSELVSLAKQSHTSSNVNYDGWPYEGYQWAYMRSETDKIIEIVERNLSCRVQTTWVQTSHTLIGNLTNGVRPSSYNTFYVMVPISQSDDPTEIGTHNTVLFLQCVWDYSNVAFYYLPIPKIAGGFDGGHWGTFNNVYESSRVVVNIPGKDQSFFGWNSSIYSYAFGSPHSRTMEGWWANISSTLRQKIEEIAQWSYGGFRNYTHPTKLAMNVAMKDAISLTDDMFLISRFPGYDYVDVSASVSSVTSFTTQGSDYAIIRSEGADVINLIFNGRTLIPGLVEKHTQEFAQPIVDDILTGPAIYCTYYPNGVTLPADIAGLLDAKEIHENAGKTDFLQSKFGSKTLAEINTEWAGKEVDLLFDQSRSYMRDGDLDGTDEFQAAMMKGSTFVLNFVQGSSGSWSCSTMINGDQTKLLEAVEILDIMASQTYTVSPIYDSIGMAVPLADVLASMGISDADLDTTDPVQIERVRRAYSVKSNHFYNIYEASGDRLGRMLIRALAYRSELVYTGLKAYLHMSPFVEKPYVSGPAITPSADAVNEIQAVGTPVSSTHESIFGYLNYFSGIGLDPIRMYNDQVASAWSYINQTMDQHAAISAMNPASGTGGGGGSISVTVTPPTLYTGYWGKISSIAELGYTPILSGEETKWSHMPAYMCLRKFMSYCADFVDGNTTTLAAKLAARSSVFNTVIMRGASSSVAAKLFRSEKPYQYEPPFVQNADIESRTVTLKVHEDKPSSTGLGSVIYQVPERYSIDLIEEVARDVMILQDNWIKGNTWDVSELPSSEKAALILMVDAYTTSDGSVAFLSGVDWVAKGFPISTIMAANATLIFERESFSKVPRAIQRIKIFRTPTADNLFAIKRGSGAYDPENVAANIPVPAPGLTIEEADFLDFFDGVDGDEMSLVMTVEPRTVFEIEPGKGMRTLTTWPITRHDLLSSTFTCIGRVVTLQKFRLYYVIDVSWNKNARGIYKTGSVDTTSTTYAINTGESVYDLHTLKYLNDDLTGGVVNMAKHLAILVLSAAEEDVELT